MAGVQSIERAFAVLRALARGSAGVTEIAERTELPKSTVSRLLSALEHEGAVVQVEVGGGYAIGTALSTLGAASAPRASIRTTVRPFIEELALMTGGSSGYTLRDGDTAYWVDNVDDGDELVLLADQTGQSFPLHTVASGLAVLARLPADALDRYLSDMESTSVDAVFSDPTALRQRLKSVRSDGVMVSREELDPGVNAVAAAFRGPDGDWDGAIYLQGPSFRFPDAGDEKRVVKLVVEAANQLSDLLAGR
ncbi:IclR family transcriptional regulator [Ilumatobacter sp.]|uniref:IclR family transcriptional regulator n=1 Tax=Ilumatobacter sp. TaxID=1967498 RepID=UPI003C4F3DDA